MVEKIGPHALNYTVNYRHLLESREPGTPDPALIKGERKEIALRIHGIIPA
jgi:hypothetical protein